MRLSDLMWAIGSGGFGAAFGGASGSRIGVWVGGTIGVGLFILICSLNLRHYLRVLASEIEKSKSHNDSKAYRFDSSWEGNGQIFDEENKPLWQYRSVGGNPFRSQVYGFVWLPPFVIQDLEGRELLAFRRISRFPFSVFEVKEGNRVIGMIRKRSFLSLVSTKYSLEFENGLRCTFFMPRFTVWFLGITETNGRFLVQLFAHRVWMVGVDRSIDSFHLIAAIAFIHRERLRSA